MDVWLMLLRGIVCFVGSIGNVVVIFVILILREYEKAATHWYVLQLAIADLTFLLTLPFKMLESSDGEWRFSSEMCKAKETILFLNYYASILFLTIMSIDRYVAVCRGFSVVLQKFRTKRAAGLITVIIWGFSIVLCTPIILFSDKRGIVGSCSCSYVFPKLSPSNLTASPTESKCVEMPGNVSELEDLLAAYGSGYDELIFAEGGDGKIEGAEPTFQHGCNYFDADVYWSAFLLFNFIVMYIMPLMIMSVCYYLIAVRVSKSRRRLRRMSFSSDHSGEFERSERSGRIRSRSAASVKSEKDRLRVTCICVTLVLVFAICWLPFHATHLAKMNGIEGSVQFCAKLASVTALVAYMNSAVNPYIYNFIGTRFGPRLRSAAGSIRVSVKKRASSFSSDVTMVRYHARKPSNGGPPHTSATFNPKISKSGKGEAESSHIPTNYNEETQVEHPLV